MQQLTRNLRRLIALFRRRQLHRDLEDELKFHIEMRAARERAGGRAEEDAHTQARRKLGSYGSLREECRDEWTFTWFESLLQDFRYSARSLARNPVLTTAIVLTLSLGVGANTAIFSAVDAALFRPFALPHAEQLIALFSVDQQTGRYVSSSHPDFLDYRERSRSLQQLGAYVRFPLAATVRGETFSLPVECVSADYFPMLGPNPSLGRLLTPDDRFQSVAVISARLWEQSFHNDPTAIGSLILIGGQPFRVVGVAPRSFQGVNLNWHEPPDAWIPLEASYLVLPRLKQVDILNQRSMGWLVLVGRLKPGVSAALAEKELQAISADISQFQPDPKHKTTIAAFPLSRAKFWPSYRDVVAKTLAMFSIAGALVLLLACANVANLLLARGLARQRETAVRLSMGISKGRLIQSHLVEAVLLMLPSSAGALGVAYGMQYVLPQFPAALGISLALDLAIDGRVLTASAAFALATTAVFVLAPLLQSRNTAPADALRPTGSAAAGMGRLRKTLVVVQIAFSTALLISGAIVGQSLLNAYSADLGFRATNLLALTSSIRPDAAAAEEGKQLLNRLASLPGVESAAFASHVPLSGPVPSVSVATADHAPLEVKRNSVGPLYFESLDIKLLAGRSFSTRDQDSESRRVIVNQTLANSLWPALSPLGRVLLIRDGDAPQTPYEVVGLAQDSKYESIWEAPTPLVYFPVANSEPNVVLRVSEAPMTLEPLVREEWRMVDEKAIIDLASGQSLLDSALQPQRLTVAILGCFAALAVLLAALGIGGVMSFDVQRTTREIGVRMAVGATAAQVVRRIISKAFVLAAVGMVLGGLPAFLWAPHLAFIAKGVATRGPLPFAATVSLISLVTIIAVLAPALRAAQINPSQALRE